MKKPLLIILILAGILSVACSEQAPQGTAKPKGESRAVLVEWGNVTQTPLAHSASRTGTLRALREIKVVTQEEGRITHLPYHEGDRVNEGDVLFELDDTLLQAELKKAAAQRQQAEQDLKRISTLQKKGLSSDEELNRARTALDVANAEEALLRTRNGYTRMKAPFSGVVGTRLAEPGDIAQRFDQLLSLIDPTSLVTEVSVSELLLPTLAVGSPVEVSIDALGQTRYKGEILRIHPTVDPNSRQGIVEVKLDPAPSGATPGQLCRVHLTGTPIPRLLIPFSALRRDAQGEFVYRIDADNKAELVRIVTGEHFIDQVEIIEGLAEGDRIVTRGFYELKPGSEVRTATAQFAKPESGKPK